ncbi:HD domain-containing protein [Candidatus Gracilibacteria bacterium]|nr:HD domain-containing protein [Candidatus Gracilibacteria bacterium]
MKLETFDDFRSYFFDFYTSIKKGHEKTKMRDHLGHGLDHDLTVAMLAVFIAKNRTLAKKAWCAAMLHSVDRTVKENDVLHTMKEHSKHLSHAFSKEEINEIIEAALRHSERNKDNQSDVQITVMDADRLANLQSAVIIRSGQYRYMSPVFNFSYLSGKANPSSTYENPETVIDGLRIVVRNYIPQLRLPKAKKLGKIYASRLSMYIKSIEEDYELIGLKNIIP